MKSVMLKLNPGQSAKPLDRDKIVRFLTFYIFYVAVPPVFDLFPLMGTVFRLLILLGISGLIVPFSEIIADIIFRFMSKNEQGGLNIYGGTVSNAILGARNVHNETHVHAENQGADTKN
jgi:hypothetical protein